MNESRSSSVGVCANRWVASEDGEPHTAKSPAAFYIPSVHGYYWKCSPYLLKSFEMKNVGNLSPNVYNPWLHTNTSYVHFHFNSWCSTENHTCLCFVCDNDSVGKEEMRQLCGHDCTVSWFWGLRGSSHFQESGAAVQPDWQLCWEFPKTPPPLVLFGFVCFFYNSFTRS